MRAARTASLMLVVWLCASLAQGIGAGEPRRPIMAASDVRAGMKGYGLTSLEGTRPQKFDVEVLGVLRGWSPKGDIVLVRMSGPVIDEAGVISGMSGSPVYIDDKLLGAVAYGWTYTKIPLAGVTPAAEMMQVQRVEAAEGDDEAGGARARARLSFRERNRELTARLVGPHRYEEPPEALRQAVFRMAVPDVMMLREPARWRGSLPAGVAGMLPDVPVHGFQPLPIPVAVSGFGGEAVPLLSLLHGTGLVPVQGAMAVAGPVPDEDVELAPGVPVGAAFVPGDMDISGMGTLTWSDGDRAVAFGHSMFGSGRTNIPLAVGHVQTVVPSVRGSFRLSTTGKIVGRITQDRESAIVARLGEQAPLFPCTVRVKGTVDEQYDYRVTGYWETAPLFTLYAVALSSTRWEGEGNRYHLKARARISLTGRDEPLELENVYNSYSVVPPSMDLVVLPIEELLLNPYREVEIEGVEYDLEVTRGFQAALIESIWTDRVRAEPGSEVTVYVRLREYRGEQLTKKVVIRVPETAEPGTQVQILVCDAPTSRMVRRSQDPGFFAPPDFESLLDVLTETEFNRNLVVRASFVEQGVRYEGDAMPALPPSALSILRYSGQGGEARPLVTDVKHEVETPWIVEGSQIVAITMEEPAPHSP